MIRNYQPDDYNRLIELWALCGQHPRAGETAEALQQINQKYPGLFLIAEDNNKMTGAVFATYDGRRGWINHLCVDPDHRQHGLASSLLDQTEQNLKSLGCHQINLLIYVDNSYNLEQWYSRRGYHTRPLQFMYKEIPQETT